MIVIWLLPDLLINQIAAVELMGEQADVEAHSAPDLKPAAARISRFTGLLTHKRLRAKLRCGEIHPVATII